MKAVLVALGAVAAIAFGHASAALAQQSAPAEVIREGFAVELDLARLIKVPEDSSMIVIGNPAIADASVQKNGLLVITGKNYGTTNVLVLNSSGETVREMMVSVRAPREQMVTVQRGFARETYSCTPQCEQTLTLGDSPEFFGGVNSQAGVRNGLAQGSATSSN